MNKEVFVLEQERKKKIAEKYTYRLREFWDECLRLQTLINHLRIEPLDTKTLEFKLRVSYSDYLSFRDWWESCTGVDFKPRLWNQSW